MKVTEIISLVLNFVLSGGLIGTFSFYRSKRRTQSAEADIKEVAADQAQVTYLKNELKDAYTEMEHIQDLMDSKRGKILELTRKVGELELKVLEAERLKKLAEYHRCTADCDSRIPPRPDGEIPDAEKVVCKPFPSQPTNE